MKRTAARWRGASQASCDRLPPADPHRRRPRRPGYWPVLPVAEGLAPSSGSMTTPSTRSRREPGCRHGRQPLHPHALDPPAPLPGPRGLGVIAVSPVADVGPARRIAEATCPRTSSRSSRPLATAATATQGGPGKRASREAGPAPRLDPTAPPAIAVGLAGRVDERDHAHRLDGPDKAVPRTAGISRSALAGFCFPPDVIVLAVRWSLRFALSYRDVEELLAERGIQCDHGHRKSRLRPMRGLKRDHSARVVISGHGSCRTFGGATTSSGSRSHHAGGWRSRSPSWL